ncbi:fibrinogen C domain-containing protein 1-like [Corticium candelabrum]|uniref:fibrinogen C domain-containing protein 1-like n=1 Tax=Corticium candelabrum TaxID=121492 RepID=UPI002E26DE57|nr:fibrinogen C domain-containing protein 1-like [Corticium candelabrum]
MANSLMTVWLLCLIAFGYCLPVREDDAQSRNDAHHLERNERSAGSIFISSCPTTPKEIPRNCQHALQLGNSNSGVYEIDPRDGLGPFNVYCDMETSGGGWTVFQRRKDGSEDFYRTWTEYQQGFGELYGEFWLGLEAIHRLTVGVTLRIDLMAPDNSKAYAEYEDFTIGNAKAKYVMYIGRYSGTAGDRLSAHKGMKFTTKDQDNDTHGQNCATLFTGAWWYAGCHQSNLNGDYRYGSSGDKLVVWPSFKGKTSLQKVEMKLK